MHIYKGGFLYEPNESYEFWSHIRFDSYRIYESKKTVRFVFDSLRIRIVRKFVSSNGALFQGQNGVSVWNSATLWLT
jgi:hypothetical protein